MTLRWKNIILISVSKNKILIVIRSFKKLDQLPKELQVNPSILNNHFMKEIYSLHKHQVSYNK